MIALFWIIFAAGILTVVFGVPNHIRPWLIFLVFVAAMLVGIG